MSKAFDTIKRETLFNDLQKYLNYDELQIVRVLLDNVKYSVKLENEIGEPFTTNIGSPQGDGISALFSSFILQYPSQNTIKMQTLHHGVKITPM